MPYTFLSENTRALDANYGTIARQIVVNLNILEEFLGLELTTLTALRAGQPPPIFSFQTDNGHDLKTRIDAVRAGIGFSAFDWGLINLTAGTQFMSAGDINAIARAVGCPLTRGTGYYPYTDTLLKNHEQISRQYNTDIDPIISGSSIIGSRHQAVTPAAATIAYNPAIGTNDEVAAAVSNPFHEQVWYTVGGFCIESRLLPYEYVQRKNYAGTPPYSLNEFISGTLFNPDTYETGALTAAGAGGRVNGGEDLGLDVLGSSTLAISAFTGNFAQTSTYAFLFQTSGLSDLADADYDPQLGFIVQSEIQDARQFDLSFNHFSEDGRVPQNYTTCAAVSESEISGVEIELFESTGIGSGGTSIASTNTDGLLKIVSDYVADGSDKIFGLRIKDENAAFDTDLAFEGQDTIEYYSGGGGSASNGTILKRRLVYTQWQFNGLPTAWVSARR